MIKIGRSGLLSAVPLAFLAVFFCWPLAALLRLGVGAGLGAADLAYFGRVAWFSAWQAAVSTLLTLLLGVPTAFVLTRLSFRGRGSLRALTLTPFVLPTVVVAAAFGALERSVPALRAAPPIALVLAAHVFYNVGVVVRLVGAVWATLDARLPEAAALLGAGRRRVLLGVTLPLLRPALLASVLLVFIYTFGSFGVVLLLGGARMATVEVEIYRQTAQQLNLGVASALAVFQLGVTGVVAALARRFERRTETAIRSVRPAAPRPPQTGAERLLAAAAALAIVGLVGAPLATLVARSLLVLDGEAVRPTLVYYATLGENPRGSLFFVPPAVALGNSLGFAALATLLALAVGGSAALLIHRAGAWRTWLALLFALPLGASGVTLGLGYLVTFGPLGLLRAWWLVPVVHTLLALPLVVQTLVAALGRLSARMGEAGLVLGAGRWRVVRDIELPLLLPGVRAAAAFAFAISLGDYGAALLLSRPETPTLPVAIGRLLGQPGALNYGQALALSGVLLALTAGCFALIDRERSR